MNTKFKPHMIMPDADPLVREFFDRANLKGLTMTRLSELCGVSTAALRHWQMGRSPTCRNMAKAAAALGLNLSFTST